MTRRGFTLIELLVVVAILAILASIAVPNMIEAQTRAKVSKCLADMNVMRGAAETYFADHTVYPRMTWGGPPFFDEFVGHGSPLQPVWGTFGPWVTTPIAYIKSYDFLDPFTGPDVTIRVDARLYTYQDLRTWRELEALHGASFNHPNFDLWDEYFGAYALMSIGPDVNLGSNGSHFHEQYDPTNGSKSAGNLWVSQRHTDRVFIPNLYDDARPAGSR